MKKMNILYCRVSSNLQSVSHQISSCEAYCKSNNILIDLTIKEEGVSAYSTLVSEREFNKILEMSDEGKVDNLVLFESSRMSRNFIEGQLIVDRLSKSGVKIHSVSDGGIINQNELDALMIAFKSFFNEKASKETSARIKSAKKMLRDREEFQGGQVGWGFEVVDRKEVVQENMKNIIIQFYEDYIHFGSKYCMNKYNIKSRTTVSKRISYERYKDIVGEILWNKANKIRLSRRTIYNETTKSTNRTDVLLEALVFHDFCKHKLVASKERNGSYSFRCTFCRGKDIGNIKKSFTNNQLEPNVEKEIEKVLDNLNKDELNKRYNNRSNKSKNIINFRIKELNQLLTSKERALKLASAKLERYIVEEANDNMINAVSNMIADVRQELEGINNELEEKKKELENINILETHQEELIENILIAKDIYRNANNIQKRSILQLLVSHINVRDNNDFDIFLNI